MGNIGQTSLTPESSLSLSWWVVVMMMEEAVVMMVVWVGENAAMLHGSE